MIPLSRPDITELEKRRVNTVLDSSHISGGPVVKEFEQKLADIAHTQYAVAVSSGTSALHLVMLSLGIGPGDEVITTPYSFIASANCILYVGAKPVFCDISPIDLNIDPDQIEAKITPNTKAILAVHVFGFPADLTKIHQIAEKYGIYVIEDACEAIGAKINNQPVGGLGIAGTFAFYPNKQITTGEGGAIVTNDLSLAETIRSLANQGRATDEQWLHHVRLGYNYRMSEIAAALGCAQMERISEVLLKRSVAAEWYHEDLRDEPLMVLPNTAMNTSTNVSWFVYVVRFCSPNLRQIVAEHLSRIDIQTRPYFPAIHLQPVYQNLFGFKEGDFPETERTSKTSLALPFFTKITREQITEVSSQIKNILNLYRYNLEESK